MSDGRSLFAAAGFNRGMASVGVAWPARRTRALIATSACVGACVLAFAAPVELRQPLLRLPGQSISNLEAISLAVFLAWLTSIAWSRVTPRWRTPLTYPWLVLLATMAVSSAWAPSARLNAWHMTGRMAFGFAIFLVTVSGGGTADRRRRVMTTALVAALIVSVLAILEYLQVDTVLRWLLAFRPGVTVVGSQLRAGGTLQYATIASMYLEIVAAYGLGLLLTAFDLNRGVALAAIFAALLVIAEAITLTFTRAGLVTLATSLALVGVGRYSRRGIDGGVRLLAVLAVLMLAQLVMSRSPQSVWLRLTSANQEAWYRAAFEAPANLSLVTGATATVPVTVQNSGRLAWDSTATPPFYLSYHWLEADADRVVSFNGLRTAFAAPVAPGTTVSVPARIRAPQRAGRYRLAWDVVQEGQLWFSTEPEAALAMSPVSVSGPSLPEQFSTSTSDRPRDLPRPAVRPGRLLLWRAAAKMLAARPLLGVGADNFRLLYGPYAGLTAADPRLHSNNMYIEMLVGGGLLGGLAFLWLLWRVASSVANGVRWDGVHGSESLGIAAAGLAIAVHGMADSFLTFTPTLILISMTLGLAVASQPDAETDWDADRV